MAEATDILHSTCSRFRPVEFCTIDECSRGLVPNTFADPALQAFHGRVPAVMLRKQAHPETYATKTELVTAMLPVILPVKALRALSPLDLRIHACPAQTWSGPVIDK